MPAYRGRAYIQFNDLSLSAFNDSIPIFHFEVIADGNPTVPITEVIDDPNGGSRGRVLIDPETGFIWAARSGIDKIFVFSCDNGLNKICEIDHYQPLFLAYSPAFTAVDVDLLGTVTTTLVTPKVWAGSNAPDSQNDAILAGYATDGSCRELARFANPMQGRIFCWPGMVHFDESTVNLQGANFGNGPTLFSGVTNGACFFITTFPLGPFGTGGGLGDDPYNTNPAVLAGIEHTADIVQGGDFIYGIDGDGRLWKAKGSSGGYTIVNVVLATASFVNQQNSVAYDPEEDAIYTKSNVFLGDTFIKKWDSDFNELWSFQVNYSGDNNYDVVRIRYHKSVGDVWALGRDTSLNNFARKINKQDGGFIEAFELSTTRHFDDFQPFPGAPFAIATFDSSPGGVAKIPLGNAAIEQSPTLAEVVTDLVERTEILTASDIDVTDLTTDTVRGYAIAQRMPIRNTLQKLMQAYFFDAVESDYLVKFIKRGQSPVMVVPPEDLDARREGQASGSPMLDERTQESELPRQLDIRFINTTSDYKAGVATQRRLIGDSQTPRTEDIPIIFTPDEAQQIVDTLLFNIWYERTPKQFSLSKRYLRLDPTDVITVTSQDQGAIDVRLTKVELSLPGLMQMEAKEEDASIYSGFSFPGAQPGQAQPGLLDTPPVALVIMDIPTLRDIDDNAGVYVVAYALGGSFRFAEVFHSIDNVNFVPRTAIGNEGGVGFSQSLLTWEGSFD